MKHFDYNLVREKTEGGEEGGIPKEIVPVSERKRIVDDYNQNL